MIYTVITLLFVYALTYIFIYLLDNTNYNAYVTMTGLFLMETSQILSGLMFYQHLSGIKSSFSQNMKAIYIVSQEAKTAEIYSF